MSYETGKAKSLEDIILSDMLQYPIWEWALDEEGVEGQDETWQRPIIDTKDVTDDMFTPTITLKVNNHDLYGSAEYDHDTKTLDAITIWFNDTWVSPEQAGLVAPVTLISIPTINGASDVAFVIRDLKKDQAKRIS